MSRRERFMREFGAEMGIPTITADIKPEDLVAPLLKAYQDGVRPDGVKAEVKRLFPNVPDFDKKFDDALVVLQNAPVSKGDDMFGISLKDSRGFLGFLRLVYVIGRPAVDVIRDPSKAPEIINQQFQRYVVPASPESIRQPLSQGATLIQKGIQSDLGKKMIEKL